MESGSYEHLEAVLDRVNLLMGGLTYQRGNGGFVFNGSLTAYTHNDKPTLRDSGIYKTPSVTAASPEKVIEKLWELIKTKQLLVGRYGDYTAIIEWNTEKGLLEKRPLTQAEDLDINSII